MDRLRLATAPRSRNSPIWWRHLRLWAVPRRLDGSAELEALRDEYYVNLFWSRLTVLLLFVKLPQRSPLVGHESISRRTLAIWRSYCREYDDLLLELRWASEDIGEENPAG